MDEEFKTQNLKRYETSAHINKALRAMIKVGLNVKADHMLGLPGEHIKAQELVRKLYAENCPTRINVFWTCFLPGTELLKNGVEKGFVSKEQEARLNEGIDFFFFNNPENITDTHLVKMYQGYELLYKLYPFLPQFIRRRLKETTVRWIPAVVKRIIGNVADVFNAWRSENPDMRAYLKYYSFHCTNFILRKYGFKTMNPVKVANRENFPFSTDMEKMQLA